MKRTTRLIWIFLTGYLSLQGQPIHFKHLDMKSGLSANQVNDIALDHHGFLLLATSQGLCRYDGREVSIVRQTDIKGFETFGFSAICKDQQQNIWIGTSKGLFMMDKSGSIIPVDFPLPDTVIGVRKILLVKEHLIFYTSKGWFMKRGDSEIIEPHPFLDRLVGNRGLNNLSVTDQLTLIAVYNSTGAIHISLEEKKILFDVRIELASTIAALADGRLACGTGTGKIYLLRAQDGQIDQVFESIKKMDSKTIHKTINDICMLDSTQMAYTSEDDGMAILDITNGKEQLYAQDIYDPNGLSTNQTVRILSDENKNFYVTSLYNGIDFFNYSRYFIKKKIVFEDEHHQPFVSYVNSIAEDGQGVFWIGATDRVIEYHPDTEVAKYHFYHELVGNYSVLTLLGFKTTCIDLKGRVWQGSFKGGIIIYDPLTKKVVKLTKYAHQGGERQIPASYIWHLSMDQDGNIWVAHNAGFMKIDPKTLDVDTLGQHPVLNKIPRKRGKHVLEDSKGRMWFGTHYSGLYRYDQETNTLDSFNTLNGIGNHCYELAEDRRGRIYVAHERGFSVINQKDSITHYSTRNGLRNRLVEGFLIDDDNNVFIANHNTIIQFNPETKQFKYFDEQFGIGEVSFKSNTAIRTHDGQMVWGTETGFISFDPEKMTSSAIPHQLTIYAIYSSRGRKFVSNEGIHVSTDEALTFEFSSVDLFGSKNVTYQYRLTSMNQHWIDLGTENRVTFSSLPPGKYTFRARASMNGVDWIEADDAPVVRISIPFYKNPTIYLMAVGLTLGLIGFVWYQRRSNQLKETVLKQQLSDLEIKAIRAQMNPHFVFNALNSIQYFTYSGNVDKANEYLSDFAKLMRLVLQQSKDGFISLESEVELLELYLKIEALRFASEFTYLISIDDELADAEHIYLPSMVIQPFVENAIKHGLIPKKGEKKLDVKFYSHNGNLYCDIRDNGIGITASKKMADEQRIRIPQTSMGMDLVRKRLNMHASGYFHKDAIEIKEIEPTGSGTLITIYLPTKH
jgi:ligand-binding sensor domain-containing protein